MQGLQELFDQIIVIIAGVWLKRHYIVIVAALICPIGWFVVAQMPDQFQSRAQVNVDTQSLLRPLLRGLTIQPDANQQVQLIARTLLTRPNLEKISRMADLDISARTDLEMEEVIRELRSNLSISSSRRSNVFNINYKAPDPNQAQAVVQAALDVFIENTMGESRTEADTAEQFLDRQIKEYEDRLLTDERKLTEFKQNNSALIGTRVGEYYSGMESQKVKLEETLLQLKEIDSRLESAKKQLADERSRVSNKTDSRPIIEFSTQYDSRIEALRSRLDELSLKYTDKHPSIIEVNRRLESLVQQQQQEINEIKARISDAGGQEGDFNPVIQQLMLTVSQLENERVSLAVRANEFESKVKDFEAKIHIIPEIEAQLIGLNRGYEITQSKYNELLSRREQARLSQNADLTADDIQFKVIDPPRVPLEPSGPNHFLFTTVVTLFSVISGVGVAFLLSQINPVALSPTQLKMVTGFPVFGTVSMAQGTKLTARELLRYYSFWFGLIGILFAYSLLVVWHLEIIQI